ncbi:UNKNOWN [Stylonychia lemnae]|uniref:Uncharacterized protein n=1 Tax=Stylonychia lemnae TaxID=5949 RepID=A0A078AHI3_STYLE|nr:UNKNOWN [Stylonychia lemnae]|eukprot:CDW81745.1 UNKNOWN [Stylonychia lemnae]
MGNIGCCSAANQTTNDTQHQNDQLKTTKKPKDYSAQPDFVKDDLIDSYRGANENKHSRQLSKRQNDNDGEESDESDLSNKYGNLHAPEKVAPNKQFVRQLSKNLGNLRISNSQLDKQASKSKILHQKQQQIDQYQAKLQQERGQETEQTDTLKQKQRKQRTNENMSVEFKKELDNKQPIKESHMQSQSSKSKDSIQSSPKKVQEQQDQQEEESSQRDEVSLKSKQKANNYEPRRQQTQNMEGTRLNNDEDSQSYSPQDSLDNSKAKNSERFDDLEQQQVFLRSQTQQEKQTTSSHKQSSKPFQRQKLRKQIASEISSSIQESQRQMEQQDEVADLENSFDQDYYEEESSSIYERSNTDFQQLKKSRNLMGNDSIQFDDEISEIGGESSMTQSKKKKKKKKKKKNLLHASETQIFDNSRDSSKLSSTNRPKTRKVKVLQL